jgi:hypothetical protein
MNSMELKKNEYKLYSTPFHLLLLLSPFLRSSSAHLPFIHSPCGERGRRRRREEGKRRREEGEG